MTKTIRVEEIFGQNVFNDQVMRERLPKKVYVELRRTIDEGLELNPKIADVVAGAMKSWAIEKGATHYTHWFQPLTGTTAEKHDSFISSPDNQGRVLMEFSGKELIKGEPDASSFPSGGLRATFEARGYTTWDCTSPAFIREDHLGATLIIPTAFCSYRGESLDQKTPLLRSMEALNVQGIRLLRLLGNTTSHKVTPSVGAEQEYFLVDKKTYSQRKDLVYTGRTLFGAMPPKGQELDDHYFGIIKDRVARFMKDVNLELWKMGVTAKTQHNEVAPGQHELACVYCVCNVAVDENQIVMETLKRMANKHDMYCLLHEKPFAGVNGSGKHNNWSLMTDDGINLLDPGHSPHENIQFLLILTSMLRAVDRHADLLRESAATHGNDHRLGADEAPPAIISVYLGEQLEDVLHQLVDLGEATHSINGGKMKTGVKVLPDFAKDATDRNRTSPFAFTGNKFEFRMVGSKDSVAQANVVLNTIVAEVFDEICSVLEKAEDKEVAIHDLIKEFATKHQRIVFNGNGYSKEWVEEAKKRGLPNITNTVDAIATLIEDKSIQLFEKYKVFSKTELVSRAEIQYEAYVKALVIEAKAMIDITSKQILPAVMKESSSLAKNISRLEGIGMQASVQRKRLSEILNRLEKMSELLEALQKAVNELGEVGSLKEQAQYCRDKLFVLMESLRQPIDELEMLVDKDVWPMPSYGDLLFEI